MSSVSPTTLRSTPFVRTGSTVVGRSAAMGLTRVAARAGPSAASTVTTRPTTSGTRSAGRFTSMLPSVAAPADCVDTHQNPA